MYMTFIKKSLPILLSFFLFGLTFPENSNGVLTVVVNGIDTPSGTIRVAVFNSPDKFLEKNGYAYSKSTPVGNNKSVRIDFNIPHGFYAVTCYHDINENKVLDQNYMGIPQEPYAMSNNVSIKWRRPTFDETKFAFNKPTQTINFDVKRWKDR
jgi:uncharacterized protein (DUF2141 family)